MYCTYSWFLIGKKQFVLCVAVVFVCAAFVDQISSNYKPYSLFSLLFFPPVVFQPTASKDGDDLFGISPPPTKPKTAPAAVAKHTKKDDHFMGDPLGGDESADLFSSASPPMKPLSVPAPKPAKKEKLGDLFDEEEDFRPSKPPPKPVAVQPVSKPPPSGGLFSDEDNDDLFSGLGTTKAASVLDTEEEAKPMPPQKKKLPGAVSMFGGGDPSALAAAAVARSRGVKESKKGELNLFCYMYYQSHTCMRREQCRDVTLL